MYAKTILQIWYLKLHLLFRYSLPTCVFQTRRRWTDFETLNLVSDHSTYARCCNLLHYFDNFPSKRKEIAMRQLKIFGQQLNVSYDPAPFEKDMICLSKYIAMYTKSVQFKREKALFTHSTFIISFIQFFLNSWIFVSVDI